MEYYNDSKATNVDATLKALEAFPGPLIVILGGKDKGSPYTPLREPLRAARAPGAADRRAAEKIAAELRRRRPIRARRHARSRRGDRRASTRSPATRCCWRRPAPVSISLRITSIAAASSSNSSRSLENQIQPARLLPAPRERMIDAAQLCNPTDRLFGVDAGPVPDRRGDGLQRLGRDGARAVRQRLHFLLRQLLWLALGIAGMFWLMNVDYRKLRQPRVIFTGLVGDAGDADRRIFSGQVARHASLDSPGAAEPAAFRDRQARGDFLSGVVSRNAARGPRASA